MEEKAVAIYPVIGNTNRKGIYDFVPGFCYPEDRSLDGLPTLKIIQELEKRDFRVLGITVEFSFSGDSMKKFKFVSNIKYGDIQLNFCWRQYKLPGYNNLYDISGLNECHIPCHSVHFYEDSGSHHFKYTGNDWSKDRDEFLYFQFKSEKKPFREFKNYLSDSDKQIFINNLNSLLDYICTFPESESRDFTNSLAENEKDFRTMKYEVYPQNYPSLYVIKESLMSNPLTNNVNMFKMNFEDIDAKEKTCVLSGESLVHCFRNNDLKYEDKDLVTD